MTHVGAFEAKNTLGGLLDRVEGGEEIVITRRGKPIAKLVPIEAAQTSDARAALLRLRALRAASEATFTADELREFRDAGRR